MPLRAADFESAVSAIPPLGRGGVPPSEGEGRTLIMPSRHLRDRAHGYDRSMAEFLVGVVVGISLAALLFIVVAPSRRLRAERRLPADEETQILLGQVPVPPPPEPSPELHPRDYDTSQIQALRRIGTGSGAGKRRSRK